MGLHSGLEIQNFSSIVMCVADTFRDCDIINMTRYSLISNTSDSTISGVHCDALLSPLQALHICDALCHLSVVQRLTYDAHPTTHALFPRTSVTNLTRFLFDLTCFADFSLHPCASQNVARTLLQLWWAPSPQSWLLPLRSQPLLLHTDAILSSAVSFELRSKLSRSLTYSCQNTATSH